MTYHPQPIDTSEVIIDTEHLKLTELLAKNTHDVWAQQRLADGWQYGPQRDDNLKQHPGLIPYEDLPDSEKEYDRLTALGVIKTLLALGYHLEGQGVIPSQPDQDREAQVVTLLQDLKKSGEINISSLLNIHRETIKIKPHTPIIYQVLGEAILQLGEFLMAYDVLKEGLKQWPDDARLRQLKALALARSGATHKANRILTQLIAQGHEDIETLALYARTYKDLWLESKNPLEQKHYLELAAKRYQQAYQKNRDIYPGINAATMTAIAGEQETAQAIARSVQEQCLQQLPSLEKITTQDYWTLATLGEANLILQQWSQATDWYQQAVKVGHRRYGDLNSTRRNAKILLEFLEGNSDRLASWFKLPRVAVFSGHMIDLPDRPQPRFPAHLETQIYQAIRERLSQLDVGIGYASAACGSDILFLEAILERKGEIHLVLPYPAPQFIPDCVDIIPNSNWRERFNRLLAQATEVNVACNARYEENTSLYQYTHRLLHGLGKIRSQQLDTELVPLAVWDGQPGDYLGGTATMVATWQQWDYEVETINPQSIAVEAVAKPISLPVIEPEKTDASRPIMALLFADVVQYSRLSEEQIGPYVEHFLGAIADLETKKDYQPALKNTWGDALYYVFPNVAEAGNFALDMCDLIQSIDWVSKGLPKELNIRISLHAGPVYPYINPITKKTNYSGSHVSYAARIEPITPPGQVYASQEFTAVICAEEVKDFMCDYVGKTPLAKGFGTFPTYHIHR